MLILENAALMWFIAGFILFILEFVTPGLILFFFAVGAWLVSILLLFVDLPVNSQLILFLIGSLATLVLFRKWLKKVIWIKRHSSEIEDEFVGKTAIAETFIGPGHEGKVQFRGTSWNAISDDTIEKGENLIIMGNLSIKLIVRSAKM